MPDEQNTLRSSILEGVRAETQEDGVQKEDEGEYNKKDDTGGNYRMNDTYNKF